jgi:hypothetical protein
MRFGAASGHPVGSAKIADPEKNFIFLDFLAVAGVVMHSKYQLPAGDLYMSRLPSAA